MANPSRTKPLDCGKITDWGQYQMISCRITFSAIPPQQFFCQGAEPPLTGLDPALITAPVDGTNVSYDTTSRFLTYLNFATNSGQKTAIDDFAREFLRIVGFEEHGFALRTGYTIPLSNHDSSNQAHMDVCLLDRRSMILLVLQDEKPSLNPSNLEPQMIALAIVTYQHNNQIRKLMGLSELDTMIVPFITMVGTRPIFYLVPVTEELNDAASFAKCSVVETEVLKCVTVAGPDRRLREGMETPEYRRVAFQHMIAFKAMAKSHWEKFLLD